MLSLKDKLSHLNYRQACKLLGEQGQQLIRSGGQYEIDVYQDVVLRKNIFRLNLEEAVVSINLSPDVPQQLNINCSVCDTVCEHIGAALSLILEEKLLLGLSAPPPEKVPIESLSYEELIKQALAERAERAKKEKMRLKPVDQGELWTDYIVTNSLSGKTYRVALRGWKRGESYCTCPDYKKNTLGTCKHILYVLSRVRKKFSKSVCKTPYQIKDICVYLKYSEKLELRLLAPEKLDAEILKVLQPLMGKHIEDVKGLIKRIKTVTNLGMDVTVFPDAEEYINNILYLERIQNKVREIRNDPEGHPLRKTLLKSELLPFQLDGIAFAVGAGRAVLADDMGLGKTIQGIGVAQLLSHDANISKVLVVCPASLKSQWRLEIKRFADRSCQLVLGKAEERAQQYDNESFFTICNYEQVLRDLKLIEKVKWDLIILDEGQRIKNWEAKTSRVIKALKSPFALVLSGTPLENRLEDLFSVVEFIDDRRLGPAFCFLNRHRVADEKGRVQGYKNLDEIRQKLKPILLRRTRKKVIGELPPRTTEIRRIPPTDEQLDIHNGQKKIISSIINKKYFTEMDFLRLQKALLLCRMSANSTFLVDKQPPGYSSKLAELDILMEQLAGEHDRKIVLFSEWTTMLNLIEPLLEKRDLEFVRLDGSVPQKKRQTLIHKFQNDSKCRLFITTNAGAVGLNLQSANTVINVDLPWNPAVLEQRISRAHRMGQKRPVQVFLLVTEGTLEESLLETLSAKHELALSVLDPEAEATAIDLHAGVDELKRRMEILLGAKPDAPEDESLKEDVERQTRDIDRKQKIENAGGQLLGAAVNFIGEMFKGREDSEQTVQLAGAFKNKLSECLDRGEEGNLKLTIALPDEKALDDMAKSLARMVSAGK